MGAQIRKQMEKEMEKAISENEDFPETSSFEERFERRMDNFKTRCLNRMAVFSKTKFSKDLSDEKLLAEFTERYKLAVPLSMVDCVLVENLLVPPTRPQTVTDKESAVEGEVE